MQIAIFHYHLNPGGVTRIIESQVAGFKLEYPDVPIVVLTGHCENIEYYKKLGVNIKINSILNYLEQKPYSKSELNEKLDKIYQWLKQYITNETIIHAHNLNLGKNPLITLAFSTFLENGYVLMNHAHDFSEDRPNNQAFMHSIIEASFGKSLYEVMYPNKRAYGVGVLNRFDYNRVVKLGIKKDNVWLFPNPVYVQLKEKPDKATNRNTICKLFNIAPDNTIITYPVRVIERKNIGELILLATLFENISFLVTLAPRNPKEIEIYNGWKAFCLQNEINIHFEAGEKANFIDIISGSDYCITTSIKEGFGMAYLEPWLIGTPVIGRNIDYVTVDIKKEGVQFPFLYKKMLVPYHCQNTDFKLLDADQQQMVIQSVLSYSFTAEEFINLNKEFEAFPPNVSSNQIKLNQKYISQNFSIEEYAKRIFRAYETLLG